MPALLLTLLPILAKFAPDLVGMAFGGGAAQVATRVEATVQRLFGTTDPAAVQAQVDADPGKADALKAQLAADAIAVKAQLADVADARAAQMRLVEAHSRLQWLPAVLSFAIVVGFFATLFGTLWFTFAHPVEMTVNQVAILNVLLGVLTAAFVQVCNFHFGTSASAVKRGDQAITAAYQARPGS